MDDIYFWRKNGGPSLEKNRIRSSLAEYCLSHLKIHASIMKSDDDPSCSRVEEFESNILNRIFYSLNKKRRWEFEESIGADLLKELNSNTEFLFAVFERVPSKHYSLESYFYGSCADNFELVHPIRKIHYLNDNMEYCSKSVKSVFGQTYHNFMENPKNVDDQEESRSTVVSYHIMRAPSNYLTFLKKSYQQSNYWGHNWPRAGYWNRRNRGKDRCFDLRYENLEDFKEELDDVEGDNENSSLDSRRKFYNLEDHLVDNFLILKKRKRNCISI